MIEPRNLDALLHPTFDTAALKAATPIAKALGAAPGAACGKIVFTAEDASRTGLQEERKWFWFVWRPHRKISQV